MSVRYRTRDMRENVTGERKRKEEEGKTEEEMAGGGNNRLGRSGLEYSVTR
jgi:hypothetical protein